MIFAIDPGSEKSAYAFWHHKKEKIFTKGICTNSELLKYIEKEGLLKVSSQLVIEMVACYGMPVGKEIFETVLWIGKFIHAWEAKGEKVNLVYRKDIKMHFCQTCRAKDSNIRQALIDRFGKPGIKSNPGKLYGVSKDIWSALACAVYFGDKQCV